MDPKVTALRDFVALARSDVRAGYLTQAEALGEVHRYCDKLWPPAIINGRRANP